MVALVAGKLLILYLTSTTRSIGALLVQEVDGTEHPVYYISRKCDPIRYLLSRPALMGWVAQWLLALAEFEISCATSKAIKCQALADLLAQFPSGQCEPLKESLPRDGFEALAANADDPHWMLSFDGAVGNGSRGTRIVLQSEKGEKFHLAYKLSFPCSNNEAEYEVLILDLVAAKERGIKHLKIVGDSKLVILQTEGFTR
ncbi:uncharacterized protein LOC131323740 [Rhododendron vialii]|uniref:uncharacterized protein LOC131323740 n=1 Tax=Rhododendron vialii TaxID=182163 RepID=UPI00265E892F|nr:uncharacterized protein LOC131323740 [Rhododendron vialii]